MRRQYTADDSQLLGQDQEQEDLISNLPSDWWEITDRDFSFPEDPSLAFASARLRLPDDDYPAVQDFHPTLFDSASFDQTSTEDISRSSCQNSTNGAKTSALPESPALSVSSFPFSEFNFGLEEDFAAADQSSSSGARRAGPSKRRRKPGLLSVKHREPLACSKCSQTFLEGYLVVALSVRENCIARILSISNLF